MKRQRRFISFEGRKLGLPEYKVEERFVTKGLFGIKFTPWLCVYLGGIHECQRLVNVVDL